MPFANEHSARIKDPDLFIQTSFRRKNIAPGIDIIIGKLKSGEGEMVTQTYRFSKEKFTAEQAKAWLEENIKEKHGFEAAREDNRMLRIDNIGTFIEPERLPNGFMRIPAAITRTGIFSYRLGNGQVRRELRRKQDVLKSDSLDTLKALVVTNEHPMEGRVTPKNAKQEQVGFSSERLDVEKVSDEEAIINTILTVTAQDALDAIEKGKRQISCGYDCELDFTPGEHSVFGTYDAIQKNILYNHISIVDRARGGSVLSLHLDSEAGICDNPIIELPEDTMKVKVDGKEFEVEEELGKKINDMLEKSKVKEDGLKAAEITVKTVTDKLDSDADLKKLSKVEEKIDALFSRANEARKKLNLDSNQLQAKLDQSEREIADLKTKNDAFKADAEKREAAEIASRAIPHMPKEYKADGKTRQEVMRDFIAHFDSKVDIKSKGDVYVEARFDAMIDQFSKADDKVSELGDKLLGSGTGRTLKTDSDVERARLDAIERTKKAWKGKE